jgi:hypothetical protein
VRLAFWNRRDCPCETAQTKPTDDTVSRTSPARLLARSLTEPESRGEWERSFKATPVGMGSVTFYKNAKRDLTISKVWFASLYSASETLTTPFTLSKAEEAIVKAALIAFDRHQADLREAEALARLTAPREGLKSDRSETPKSGSTAKRRKPGPSGRAQKDAANA